MNDLKLLRTVGTLEGISFLFLLLVAMPLKYMGGMPAAVTYAGLAHGALFLAFLVAVLAVSHRRQWPVWVFLLGLLAAVLPFGPFVFDAWLGKRYGRQ